MRYLKFLSRPFKKDIVTYYDGCTACYGSGAVRLPTGNRHVIGPDIFRPCPYGCEMTHYGRGRLERGL